MKRANIQRFTTITGISIGLLALTLAPASALSSGSSTNQAQLSRIISRGNAEIDRRLATLNTLSTKINGAAKLNAGDKSSLGSEVSAEISGLTTLKTQLDAATDVTTAKTDAQSIINEYRVYALVGPKVNIVREADDQLTAETKLTSLATALQTKLASEQSAGKSVTSLESALSDMTSKVSAAQTLSTTVETSVLPLQPSDYNSDHTILSGYRDQLKTAQSDLQAAVTDGKTIVTGLKNL